MGDGGGKRGEREQNTQEGHVPTLARRVWRAEHSGNQWRQVLVCRTRRLAGEVDQICTIKAR